MKKNHMHGEIFFSFVHLCLERPHDKTRFVFWANPCNNKLLKLNKLKMKNCLMMFTHNMTSQLYTWPTYYFDKNHQNRIVVCVLITIYKVETVLRLCCGKKQC